MKQVMSITRWGGDALARALMRITICLGAVLCIQSAAAKDEAAGAVIDQHLPSVWDLQLGAHWRELPTADYIDFACGTDGGPPSTQLPNWSGYQTCSVEPATGLREVYFEYDDEQEYIGRARNLDLQVMRHEFTWVNGLPVIASALFDADGFLVGVRLVSDPRVDQSKREKGMVLAGFMQARYGEAGWLCTDLPKAAGESAFLDIFVKRHCSKDFSADGRDEVKLDLDIRNMRRAGQATIGWDNVPTDGEFESTTRFQAVLAQPIQNRETRLANFDESADGIDPVVTRAKNCPGCDLKGANLKRADLTGANLAGADLTGANLHGAVLARADLTGAILTSANLNRVDLRRAKLINANLQKAMLFNAMLDGADLSGASLNGAMAGTARFASANLTGASARAVDFRDSRLNDTNFTGADLTSSWMHNAQVTRANFTDAILIYLDAKRANFADAKLNGVDARGADFFGASFRKANLSGADFSFTRLSSANLFSATLDGANFDQSELPGGFKVP